MSGYAELHCRSNFSFLNGASHPEELVERAATLGYAALALTDLCSLAGVVRAHQEAKARGLKLLVGSEIRITDGPALVLLATDRAGYGRLATLITRGRRRAQKGCCRIERADLAAGLPGCVALWLPLGGRDHAADGAWLKARFGDTLWVGVGLHLRGDDAARLAAAEALGRALGLPLVALGSVLMHVRRRQPLHDCLTAIRYRVAVADAGLRLEPNAERHLRPLATLARLYPRALLDETLRVAARCRFSLDELRYAYPDELIPPGHSAASHLRALTEQGIARRWPGGVAKRVRAQIEHELALISELRYEHYFLTVHDIVDFARSRGILCQGRGSAANSAVCYCLGITEVDPARMAMLFERFISRERNEPPDIDVDFEHQRREEVIQYIYAKYGRERAALAATVIRYRPRSAVRDLGKALGLDLDQVDRLAKNIAWWDGREVLAERIGEAGLDPHSRVVRQLVWLLDELLGFPRHLSQHVGGFVIARGPVCELVPIENAAMAERTLIQWDKDDLDALGLLKIDCLALGMLSAIRRAFDLINGYYRLGEREAVAVGAGAPAMERSRAGPLLQPLERAAPRLTDAVWERPGSRSGGACRVAEGEAVAPGLSRAGAPRQPPGGAAPRPAPTPPQRRGEPLGLDNLPPEDPAVYAMIQRADTVGVFQIESRAQMAMLPRLRPVCFYDLVIEVAIVRPGPIQGDMVHPYLRRRRGEEPVSYPSDAVREVLGRTLGVPIFQEQVIHLAQVAAGFSPGEADRLRRSIGAFRRRGNLEEFERRLIDGMTRRGYDAGFAHQLFNQILGFGEYGFPESHAASFALLVYASAWLKHHEPAAFCAALLNSQPMGFYAPAQLVQAARRAGVEVRPVAVEQSDWESTLEHGSGGAPALRLGLHRVKGLSQAGGERLVAARRRRRFTSVAELARRAGLDRGDLQALARADALSGLAGNRHRAAWAVLGIESPAPLFATLPEPRQQPLPLLPVPTEGGAIVADYATTGLTLRRHPLALLRARLTALRLASVAAVRALEHGRSVYAGGLVIGRQRPGSAGGVTFVTLEDETGHLNVIVWRQLGARRRRELLGARLLGVIGEVQREGEVLHLIARELVDHSRLLGRLEVRSRDFH